MENFNQSSPLLETEAQIEERSKKLVTSSFSWMALALTITAIAAFLFSSNPDLLGLLISDTGLSAFGWVIMFAPIGLVLLMSARLEKMSLNTLIACFVIYSAVNGISLFFIFLIYDLGSIFNVFLSTIALFGLFAAAGYFTKTDLTKLGSILFIGLIGIMIASLINIFMQSDSMGFIISILGVIIFTGLTAYDVQKIKNMGYMVEEGSTFTKVAIMGALRLYLDFINLFLFLLRLFGGRK
jgi:uncharacterized protein